MRKITLDEFLMGREKIAPLTDQMSVSAFMIIYKANLILEAFGEYREVSSGYRPPVINAATPHAAKHSNHMFCLAVDLKDPDGRLHQFCKMPQSLRLLERLGVYCEERQGPWQHLQIVPPASGKRWFFP